VSKGSRQRPTAPTYWDNYEKVFYSKDEIFNKPKRKQVMTVKAHVLNDVKCSWNTVTQLGEYFSNPVNGYNTVNRTSEDTGIPKEEVKAYCEAFKVGMV